MASRNHGGQCLVELALMSLIFAALILYLITFAQQARPLLTRMQLSHEEPK